jgi:hypothetical protein
MAIAAIIFAAARCGTAACAAIPAFATAAFSGTEAD